MMILIALLCLGVPVCTAYNNVWYVNPNQPPLPSLNNPNNNGYWTNNIRYRQTNAPIHVDAARTFTTAIPPPPPTMAPQVTLPPMPVTTDRTDTAGSDFALRILEILGLRKPRGGTIEEMTTVRPGGISPSNRDVCPFDATPLIENNRYRDCNPRNMLDCPQGYLCDRSFLLGRHVCCQDFSASTLSTTTETPTTTMSTTTPTPTTTTRITTTTTTTPTPTTQLVGNCGTTEGPISSSTWDPLMPEFPGSSGANPNVSVSLLSVGKLQLVFEGQYAVSGTISLVRDGMTNILVDLGSPEDTEKLLDALARERVSLDDIDLVIITHGHPDHFANYNFFRNKPMLFGPIEMSRDRMSRTLLSPRPYRRLTQNTEIWKTPGHTRQDISLVVRNVQGYGTIGIVGDLISNEHSFLSGDNGAHPMGHWDEAIQKQNANLMMCICDWIVPGHGTVFQVTQAHRIKASCSRLNMDITKYKKQ